MKIVTIDTMPIFPEHVKELQSLGEFIYHKTNPVNDAEAKKRIKDADIVINFWYTMGSAILNSAKNLKLICMAAVGFDWIDLKTCKEKNIVVCNCPGHNAQAVAEHAIYLLIDAAKHASLAQRDFRNGLWKPVEYKGKELNGKTLGIIGYGNIGKIISQIAKRGFNMKILFVNSKSSRKELEFLLTQSDFISINIPLNDKTNNFISEKEFSLMKNGVIIVNTARGGVIDPKTFLKYLHLGKIFGAGVDSYIQEPPKKSDDLFSVQNLTMTPHMAWNTEESEYRLSEMVVQIIKRFIAGRPIYVSS